MDQDREWMRQERRYRRAERRAKRALETADKHIRIMIEANERQKAIEARGADIDPE